MTLPLFHFPPSPFPSTSLSTDRLSTRRPSTPPLFHSHLPHLTLTESTFTPWFKLIAQSFLYKWWDALLASRTAGSTDKLDAKVLIKEVEKEVGLKEIQRY